MNHQRLSAFYRYVLASQEGLCSIEAFFYFGAWLVGLLVDMLSPCDFHLIPKMKEPLRGIRFRTVPEILQAVDRSIRTINTTDAAKGIVRLPNRWQRVVHNAGDYTEGQ